MLRAPNRSGARIGVCPYIIRRDIPVHAPCTRVVARILQLAAQSGRLANDATIYLDEAGPATPERIASKAERWCQNRNSRDLGWLYHRYLDGTKSGTSIDSILRLLGKPTEKRAGFYSWKSKASPIRLYLETDKNGNLDWMKLYDE